MSNKGYFGQWGGAFIPEVLFETFQELKEAFAEARQDEQFWREYVNLMSTYSCRPTPLTFAENLTRHFGGARIYIKREDLNHTGAHKANNVMGQGMLVKRMGKKRVIAETGAGQHGVATATACAHFGLDCVVYMGQEDIRRQAPNVANMRMLGAEVRPVTSGSCTLRDAVNEALRDWMASVETTHYILGSVVGPHPFPRIVRDFQSVIGRETLAQCQERFGRMPELIVACVGGGSNAAGMFYPFIRQTDVPLLGVEAGGRGTGNGAHAAPLCLGQPGVLHGSLSYVMQNDDGQTSPVHSVSAGLDYPGVGPEHSYLKDQKRVVYDSVTDDEALEAFHLLARVEGIIPALESAHALAGLKKHADSLAGRLVVVNLSGRGDKDVETVAALERGKS